MHANDHEGLPIPQIVHALREAQKNYDSIREGGTYPILQLLSGAAMALAQAIDFRREHLKSGETDDGLVPNDHDLAGTVAEMLDTGRVDWNPTPRFRVWALGYHLNKAQENIAAAFDKIVNGWLVRKLGFPTYEPETEKEQIQWLEDLLHRYVGSRVGLLANFSPIARLHLSSIDDAFRTYGDTTKAARARADWAKTIESNGGTLAHAPIPFQPVDCLAIICGRVNRLKHRPETKTYAGGFGYLAGIGIIAHAQLHLHELWNVMRSDIEELMKETPPREP